SLDFFDHGWSAYYDDVRVTIRGGLRDLDPHVPSEHFASLCNRLALQPNDEISRDAIVRERTAAHRNYIAIEIFPALFGVLIELDVFFDCEPLFWNCDHCGFSSNWNSNISQHNIRLTTTQGRCPKVVLVDEETGAFFWSAARSVRTRRFGCFESPPGAKAARTHRPRRTPNVFVTRSEVVVMRLCLPTQLWDTSRLCGCASGFRS